MSERMATVGSSDVATILGVNRWGSVWEVWARLVGLVPRYGGTQTPAMRRGTRLEDAVGQWHATEAGLILTDCPKVGEEPLPGPEPWMHDRPDFLALPVDSVGLSNIPHYDRAIEVKTARYLDEADGWGPPGGDAVPLHVAAQSLWHMICQDLDRCDVVAFGTVRDDFRSYELQRRAKLANRVLDAVRNWYEHHVVDGHHPALDGSAASVRWAGQVLPYVGPDTSGMRQVDKQASRIWLDATPADLALARDMTQLKAAMADLAAQQNALKARMMERIGGAYGLRSDGHTVAIWPAHKGRVTCDIKRLRADLGEPAEQYLKQGRGHRRLDVRSPKE